MGRWKKCLSAIRWLADQGINPAYIVDSNSINMPNIMYSIPVVSPAKFYEEIIDDYIVISSDIYGAEIINDLETHSFSNYVLLSEVDNFGRTNEINRDEWIKKKLLSIPNGKKILDAGAGEQRYRKYCKHLNYTSQDFCEYDGKGAGGLQPGSWNTSKIDIVSDITSIPVEDDSFDVILCTEVLEHINNPGVAIEEFARILKKGGELIITAPFCSLSHMAPYYFYSGFSIYWYRDILCKYGFRIAEDQHNGNYFSYIAQELRRIGFIGKSYAQYDVNEKDVEAIEEVISILRRMDANDTMSYELLCYGYHIDAYMK